MAKKRVYKSEEQAEAAKAKAVRFTDNQLGDPGRAAEIESQSLDEWLTETGRRIENPNEEMSMTLKEENEILRMALDEANNRLARIYDLSSEEIEPEDFEDEDFEDEEAEGE